MEEVKKEQVSEILIPETINDKVSIKTNSESQITILSQGLEIAPLTLNTQSMQTAEQISTFMMEEVITRHQQATIDDLHFWNDTAGIVNEMIQKLREWPVTRGKGFHYIPLKELFGKIGIPPQQAYDTLQMFDLIDFKKKWAPEMTRYGLVFNHEYEGCDPQFHQEIWFTPDIASAHGHEFFIEFFKLTKDWFS